MNRFSRRRFGGKATNLSNPIHVSTPYVCALAPQDDNPSI